MFPCSGCGLCCQNISHITELKNYDLGNGVCRYFDLQTRSCLIYDLRPNICRIDMMWELKYYEYFTREEFYIENAIICNNLQEQYNLDDSFRIKIGELRCHYHLY